MMYAYIYVYTDDVFVMYDVSYVCACIHGSSMYALVHMDPSRYALVYISDAACMHVFPVYQTHLHHASRNRIIPSRAVLFSHRPLLHIELAKRVTCEDVCASVD
jgi:hypothetical protein